MTQDELKLEEACREARLNIKHQVDQWLKEMFDQVASEHQERLHSNIPIAERQQLLQQELEDSLYQRIQRKMLLYTLQYLEPIGLFSREQILSIQSQVGLSLERMTPSIPIVIPESRVILEPLRSGLAVAGFILLSFVILGSQISNFQAMQLPFLLVLSGLSAYLLVQWQRKATSLPANSRWMRSFSWISTSEFTHQEWLELPKHITHKVLMIYSQIAVNLVQAAAQLELLRVANRQQHSDQLQHLFARCLDSFSEVYYSQFKLDADRSLDACMNLIGDIKDAGIEIIAIDEGAAFDRAWAENFNIHGRIDIGDPVMMIYPAWRYHHQLLVKGTLKKCRR
jgi:hypothetical protein